MGQPQQNNEKIGWVHGKTGEMYACAFTHKRAAVLYYNRITQYQNPNLFLGTHAHMRSQAESGNFFASLFGGRLIWSLSYYFAPFCQKILLCSSILQSSQSRSFININQETSGLFCAFVETNSPTGWQACYKPVKKVLSILTFLQKGGRIIETTTKWLLAVEHIALRAFFAPCTTTILLLHCVPFSSAIDLRVQLAICSSTAWEGT